MLINGAVAIVNRAEPQSVMLAAAFTNRVFENRGQSTIHIDSEIKYDTNG